MARFLECIILFLFIQYSGKRSNKLLFICYSGLCLLNHAYGLPDVFLLYLLCLYSTLVEPMNTRVPKSGVLGIGCPVSSKGDVLLFILFGMVLA